ncbi:MAG: Holliday junction resolvase RuvX [Sporichthyaceae bacterium]
MTTGVRLGVDLGSVRIGVAASDRTGMLAVPVETVPRGKGDLDRLSALVEEHEAVAVFVGLPRSLSGKEGPAATGVREWAAGLAARLAPVEVRLVDERLSTVSAAGNLRASGVSAKKGRSVVDQAAAVVFLQAALDTERATGNPPGEPVAPA